VGRDFAAEYEYSNNDGHACGCCRFQQFKGEGWKSIEVLGLTKEWKEVLTQTNSGIVEDCMISPEGEKLCYGDGEGGSQNLSEDGCKFSMRDSPGFAFHGVNVAMLRRECLYIPNVRSKCRIRYKDCLSYGHKITDVCGGGRVVSAEWFDLDCCTVELEIDFDNPPHFKIIQ
jgi:hypothetical protein